MDYTANVLPLAFGVVLAWVVLYTPVLSRLSQYISTLFHEAGHAISALFLGGKVQGIRLEANGSGLTTSGHVIGLGFFPTRVAVLLSGYSFPVNIGITVLTLVFLKVESLYILIFFAIVGGLTLLFIRNFVGLLITFTYLGLIALAFLGQDLIPLNYSISFLGGILLVNGVKDIIGITRLTFRTKQRSEEIANDFTYLRDITFISPRIWNILYIISQIAALPIIIVGVATLNPYLVSIN